MPATSPFDDPPDRWDGAGTVYVFDEKTGGLLLRIPHPDPDPYPGGNLGDVFGRAMAVHEGNILVGAAQDDPGGVQGAGALYLVDINTGETLMTIPNPYPGEFDFFSYPVASINGNIVAAAPRAEAGGVKGAGAVYVFDGKTGALLNRIEHPDPSRVTNGQGNFGWNMAAHGSYLAVTSTGTDVAGYQAAGALYVFDFNTGSLLLEIPNPHPASNAYFGRGGVTWHGGQIATGSTHAGDILNAGSIYLFEGF